MSVKCGFVHTSNYSTAEVAESIMRNGVGDIKGGGYMDNEREKIRKAAEVLESFGIDGIVVSANRLLEAAESAQQWQSIDDALPEPFIHVALLDMNSYQNCPEEMHDRCHNKAIGYMHEDKIQKYWQIKGERGCAISGYTHWMPLPDPPKQ